MVPSDRAHTVEMAPLEPNLKTKTEGSIQLLIHADRSSILNVTITIARIRVEESP
ncbi:MAG: hypothetical protein QW220_06875 [Candidatus Bathyarchaeia archaeon]